MVVVNSHGGNSDLDTLFSLLSKLEFFPSFVNLTVVFIYLHQDPREMEKVGKSDSCG